MKKLLLSIFILFALVGSAYAECETVYFVINAADTDMRKHKTKLISAESFKVIKDKKQKIKEVKGKSLLEEIGKAPVPILLEGVEIGTEEHVYPELNVQSTVVATLPDGRQICHVLKSPWIKEKTKVYHDPESESQDPLEEKNRKYLGIDAKYIGPDREDVFRAFPVLIGQEQIGVDESGYPIMVDKLRRHKWSCED